MELREWLTVFLFLCSFGLWVQCSSSTDPVRLVGQSSGCAGTVELKHRGEWRPVSVAFGVWDLKATSAVCRDLDCGSAVSGKRRDGFLERLVWMLSGDCVKQKSALRDCVKGTYSSDKSGLEVVCLDSVRLLHGPRLCSGSLQVHWDQSWSSVCEEDFDLQDAEVVCRELGCEAPSLLQGALYREGRAPLGQTFQCEGHESALMNCSRSSSGNTCSSRKALDLTCSDPDDVRLVGGASRCDGALQLKHLDKWRDVEMTEWNLKTAASFCRRLDCGSVISVEERRVSVRSVWMMSSSCVQSTSSLRECVDSFHFSSPFLSVLTCSDSVRLLQGPRLCSGSLEVHWDQSWTSVCEEDFDLQDADVVCRELGCGAPSLLQGALYREGRAPLGQTFQCEGHESALMNCTRSSSGNTCSSGKAVDLTCSEPVRLVGQSSRCAGTVEVRHRGEWRPVSVWSWDLEATAAVCRDLDCGSAVSEKVRKDFLERPVWRLSGPCVKQASALRDCVEGRDSSVTSGLEVVCSGLLNPPNISLSVSADGVSEAQPQGLRVLLGSDFSVTCSVLPQFPGGSFQLIPPTVDPAQNHTLPAVNHSAHFLFSDAGSAHRGGYTCVYHLHVFSHNFSSQSQTLYLTLGASVSDLIIRVLVILLLKLIYIPALYFYFKSTRGQQQRRRRRKRQAAPGRADPGKRRRSTNS